MVSAQLSHSSVQVQVSLQKQHPLISPQPITRNLQSGPKVFDQIYNSIKNLKLPGKNVKLILFDGYIYKVYYIAARCQ
jgi:hypothetical protein